MKRRFSINENGELEDRDGLVLGTVIGLTIDAPKSSFDALRDAPGDEAPEPSESGVGGCSLNASLLQDVSEEKGPPAPSATPGIEQVWEHYVKVMAPRSAGLGPEERRIIRDALNVASVDECCAAIDGCRASDFHMGKNDRQRKYNALSQIIKGKRGGRTTRESIDFFIDLLRSSGLRPGVPSGLNDKVRRAMQRVRDAATYPGDERLVEIGDQARSELQEMGWTVQIKGSDVSFTPPARS